MIIGLSIDLTKIDKSKIIEGKEGRKYYNLSVFVNDEKDQYDNDVSVAEGQTKEQREAKEKKNYLGNGRVVFMQWPSTKKKESEASTPQSDSTNNQPDDLPF